MKQGRLVRSVAAGLTVALVVSVAIAASHREDVEQWRADREERLASEGGWLTLVGLHWLEPGENRFGSDGTRLVFPDEPQNPYAGSLFLEESGVRIEAAADSGLTLGDEPAAGRSLRPDTSGDPDVLHLGDLRFYVIERAGRYGVRVKNPASPVRTGFRGLDYFAIDAGYRVVGRFVPYDEPKEVAVATVIGTRTPMLALGRVEFELNGETLSLEPFVSSPEDDSFWFIFKDATSGKETYGAGRYLSADREQDGRVTIDFNYAYNPPCAFTPYATCPLPPRRNWLAVPVRAGEKRYGEAH